MNSKVSIISVLSFIVISCSPKPSKIVLKTFENKFPYAKDVSWKKEYNGMWEASFYLKKFYYLTVTYSSSGTWVSTEKEVFEEDIPLKLLTTLNKKYPNYFLIRSFKKTKIDGVEYEFELEKDGKILVLINTNNDGLIDTKKLCSHLEGDFIIEND